MDNFIYRPARPEDRDEIFAFTAHTWENGDYISYVFDDWLADTSGIFLVIENTANHKLAGLDKLTMLAPGEAWFEGLRIRDEYRGRGLASQVQTHMIGEARRLGAKTIRLLTRDANTAIHIAASRDGFSQIGLVRPFNWRANEADALLDQSQTYNLRPATVDEARKLYRGWRQLSAYRVAGLINHSWSYRSTTLEEWQIAAAEGLLLVDSGAKFEQRSLPDPCVLIKRGGEAVENAWTICTISGTAAQWPSIIRGLISMAEQQQIAEIEGMLSDEHAIQQAAAMSGINQFFGKSAFHIYELNLQTSAE